MEGNGTATKVKCCGVIFLRRRRRKASQTVRKEPPFCCCTMRRSITIERRLELQPNRSCPMFWRFTQFSTSEELATVCLRNFALPPHLISRMALESGTFSKEVSEGVGALYQHDYSLSVPVCRKVWPCGIYTFRCGSELVTFSG